MQTTKFDGPTAPANRKLELCQYIHQIAAVGEVIRCAGDIPSGILYAMVMDKMDLQTYNNIIAVLKRTNLIVEKSFLLIWIGPI